MSFVSVAFSCCSRWLGRAIHTALPAIAAIDAAGRQLCVLWLVGLALLSHAFPHRRGLLTGLRLKPAAGPPLALGVIVPLAVLHL